MKIITAAKEGTKHVSVIVWERGWETCLPSSMTRNTMSKILLLIEKESAYPKKGQEDNSVKVFHR